MWRSVLCCPQRKPWPRWMTSHVCAQEDLQSGNTYIAGKLPQLTQGCLSQDASAWGASLSGHAISWRSTSTMRARALKRLAGNTCMFHLCFFFSHHVANIKAQHNKTTSAQVSPSCLLNKLTHYQNMHIFFHHALNSKDNRLITFADKNIRSP